MKRVITIMSVAMIMVMASATSIAQQTIKTKDFSGWMENYENLIFDKERNAFIFENDMKRGVYKTVMLESVVLHGEGVERNRGGPGCLNSNPNSISGCLHWV